jgi:Domain of unknown function (DUF5658)
MSHIAECACDSCVKTMLVQGDRNGLTLRDMKRWMLRGAVILLAIQVIDLISTFILLSRGLAEMNPIAAPLLDSHWIIPVKFAIAGYFAWQAWTKEATAERVALIWWITGIYTIVVSLNLLQVFHVL